ncbi:PREDICTED: E3 ubiquitin-protein ligase RFWD3-like isoform X3 [Trachymyrmex septentrionalis]|uniref:E3 ubiquitin-protein ligase RFWD3-like isoform X3 n=1 Tax=Trachymyrmex septentrionalis TaxID=34720 RepID=UPI00084F5EE6|nr:PREDICTED: E3 ubiquitin-protein ligase RFWD3-like isoform X3 [Trachymyrmex septentrionalis]
MEGNENVEEQMQIEEQVQAEDRVQVEEQVRVEERMQVEGQDVEDQYENENIIPNDVQNNEESNTGSKSSQRTNATSVNLDVSDVDSDQSCPICMEQWTSSGEHRLCCLRCGHLFGHSCILRWLQYSCNSTNRRCPQCNKKASVKHIRMLYAKKLTAIDSTEYDNLKKDLIKVSAEKNNLRKELACANIRLKVYEDHVNCMKKRITELENQKSKINVDTCPSASSLASRKFHLEQSVEICKDGGCRVLDYNPWYKLLAVSQKSTTSLFNGYGVRKMDCECFNLRQFIFLHTQAIRDLTFHSTQQTILLSVGFDKCAKLVDIQNNVTVHTYQTECPLWSCCWSGDNPNVFLTGAQNGVISQFDIRQTSSALSVLEGNGDKSPVVSMAGVPPNPGSGIGRGGFIACRLNTCYTYEIKDTNYLSKQMFIEGPFVSVRYDEKNHHCLISSRPNSRQPHARHIVCTIERNTSNEEIVTYNAVHTFQAGNSQQLLSRPCYLSVEDDTLVAAYIESSSSVSLWSIATGQKLHNLPVSDPVMDLCSFNINNNLFLTSLSAKKLRLYNYGQLTQT